jgi:hypothetical protein
MGTAEELNVHLAEFCVQNELPASERLTEEDMSRVRQKRGELFTQWDAVEPGNALELPFDPVAFARSAD